jgi:Na+/H+ antiporter NhaC
MGAFIAGGMRLDSIFYFFQSLLNVITDYIIRALNDFSHLAVIIFSLLIGGMVALISKNGGMTGVVNSLSRYAKTPASAQIVTWFLGIAIFFDDYANTLIVGNTMRPVTDRFKISREKLAYIVDSTAAPVAAIAFITTWIGAELGYIDSGIQIIGFEHINLSPYAIFIQSLRYSFYPILTLAFVFFLIRSGREYGPMHHAETRARLTGQVSPAATPDRDEPNMENLSPVSNAPNEWIFAVIPILSVILVTFYGLLHTGFEAIREQLIQSGIIANGHSWREVWHGMHLASPGKGFLTNLGDIIGQADPYTALLWSSFAGVTIAILMTVGGRIIKLFDTMHYLVTGFKTMIPAVIILTLAWSLAITTEELRTAEFLTMALKGSLNPYLLPGLIFILAALTSFSTGSSWSTMAILYPIAIPTSWAVSLAAGLSPEVSTEILFNVIAVVLAASVLGDHCSPISDTTILSSLASDCNHIDHVRTQLPYALTVGLVSLMAGTFSSMLGGGWAINTIILLLSMATLWLIIRKVGKRIEFE